MCDAGKTDIEACTFHPLDRLFSCISHPLHWQAYAAGINLRSFEDGDIGVSLDETVTQEDLHDLLRLFYPDSNLVRPIQVLPVSLCFYYAPVCSNYALNRPRTLLFHRTATRSRSLRLTLESG